MFRLKLGLVPSVSPWDPSPSTWKRCSTRTTSAISFRTQAAVDKSGIYLFISEVRMSARNFKTPSRSMKKHLIMKLLRLGKIFRFFVLNPLKNGRHTISYKLVEVDCNF